jgi:hypothetical protein
MNVSAMSKKKRNRQQQKARQRGRTRGSRASLVFIALIVFFIAVAAAMSVWTGSDRPSCPPGQVWSDAHNHCH